MTTLKVFFESLNQTFTIEPLGSLFSANQYWVIEEEREEWYRVSGMPTAIMLINGGKAVCHGEVGVRHGRVV
jgi:hypothetical protein